MKEVLKIRTQGSFTPDTKYYKFLFMEIHYGKYHDKFEFLKQLLFTLEEQSLSGIYEVKDPHLIEYLTCNGHRYKIFNYVVHEGDKGYIAISNTQIDDFINLKKENRDTGKEHKCSTIGKNRNDISRQSLPNKYRQSLPNKYRQSLPNISRQSLPNKYRPRELNKIKTGLSSSNSSYRSRQTKRGLSTDDGSQPVKRGKWNTGGKTKKQRKKKE